MINHLNVTISILNYAFQKVIKVITFLCFLLLWRHL